MKLSVSFLTLWLSASTTLTLNNNAAWAFVTPTPKHHHHRKSSSPLFYDIQGDAPNENSNVWSVLTTTEKWIASTLQDAWQPQPPAEAGGGASSAGNPLSRKEVTYVCETSTDPALILATIFRKLKEARELGETHAHAQDEDEDEDDEAMPHTLRQTQVMVIPANKDVMDFKVFDKMIQAINQARRNARDYVTDVSLEKLDDIMYGEGDRDWCVSVNCAHLHPLFGEKTPEEQLKEMKEEEEEGEVDLNLKAYKERRLQARRSPYPSVVVEVRATLPPEFTPPPGAPSPKMEQEPASGDDDVTSDFVNQLEALFAKSTLDDESSKKDGGFYESIGSHIEEISAVTPMSMAQTWIDGNDPLCDPMSCAFTSSDTAHVDEAYEFVFSNLAMQTSAFLKDDDVAVQIGAQKRQYLVMPNFCTSSATSMEKFAMEVLNMVQTIPSIRNKVDLTCLHPEHIDESKRCPIPVFVLQWKE